MPKHRRSPRRLGMALDGIRGHWAPETLLGEIQTCWSDVVGPAIAAEATPASERSGVVTIACSGSVWAQELDLMAPTIIERLNGVLIAGKVTKLRCVATPHDDRT